MKMKRNLRFLLEVQDIRSETQQLVTTHHSTTGCAFAKVAPFVWPHGTSEMLKDANALQTVNIPLAMTQIFRKIAIPHDS